MVNIGVVCLDPGRDGGFIPYAKSQARVFAQQWRGFYMSRTLRVEDTMILIEVWAADQARVSLYAATIYMESGFLDIRGVGFRAETTYMPSLVRFSPDVAALSKLPRLPNAKGHKIEDGSETWTAAGCRPDEKTKTVSPIGSLVEGDDPFSSETPKYCEPNAILARKMLLQAVPPSVFTGKLKLFVQALYGSSRTDFRLSTNGSNELSIMTNGMTVPRPPSRDEPQPIWADLSWGYPTSGLMTTPNGEYLLLTVMSNGVFYRTMTPRPSKRALKDEHEEAYALAALTPGGELLKAAGTMPAHLTLAQPLAYGWHFSKTGDVAHMVIKQNETINGKIQYAETPGQIGGYRFTLLRLDLTWDAAKKELSFSVTPGATGLHIPYLYSKMFVPTPSQLGMLMVMPSSDPPWQSVTASLEAPVYCYYDKDDVLQTVVASNSTFGKVMGRATPFDLGAMSSDQQNRGAVVFQHTSCAPSEFATFQVTPDSYFTPAFGFTVGGESYKGDEKWAPGQTSTDILMLAGGGRREEYHRPIYDPGTLNLIGVEQHFADYYSLDASKSYRIQSLKTDLKRMTTPVFVIPYDDASAAIVGVRNIEEAGSTRRFRYVFGNNICYKWPNGYNMPPGRVEGAPPWNSAGDLSWALVDQTGTLGQRTTAPKVEETADKTDTIIDLHSSAPRVRLYEYSATNNPDTSQNVYRGEFSALFECRAADGMYPRRMSVRSSYFGAARHDSCLAGSVTPNVGFLNGWPDEREQGEQGASTPIGYA